MNAVSSGSANGRGGGSVILLLVLVLAILVFGVFSFVSEVNVPPHVEAIEPIVIPTLEGIAVAQPMDGAEGYTLVEPQPSVQGGFSLVGPEGPVTHTFDDLPVYPGKPFKDIAKEVKEAMSAEDPEMLSLPMDWIVDPTTMQLLFDPEGRPLPGVTARWHGYYAKHVMFYKQHWLPPEAATLEPSVLYWSLYLLMRANLHEQNGELPEGSAPWEWPDRMSWLDWEPQP